MTYMGGKQRLAKSIVPYINSYIKEHNIENFYDLMCGGFNIGVNVECENIYANDLSPTLIALHQTAQKDYSMICTDSSREQWDRCYSEYKRIKDNNFENPQIPLAEIGAIEWFASYNGRGFPGGYGVKCTDRDLFQERYNNLKRQSLTPTYQKTHFTSGKYNEVEILPNSLIYCDAPYYGTKMYGVNKNFSFDEYYEWLVKTAKTTPIFISEQFIPDTVPAQVVWQKDVKRTIGQGEGLAVTETLYLLDLR